MVTQQKTVIVTGASRGIGAKIAMTLLERGYSVVANARNMTSAAGFEPSPRLAMVNGSVAERGTAAEVVETAVARFGSIDAVVNNAGIFFTKRFLDYTMEDLRSLMSINVEGYIHMTQLAIKQMLIQKSRGCIVTITSSLVEHPIAGVTASLPMITKGGLEALTRSLAMEYVKEGIRVNAVAPGQVDTPMHAGARREDLERLSPMGKVSGVNDIADAIAYLLEAETVTGEVLHVDGGAHLGKW
jgi:NAD(P)-dependent dehydrogenase (short-subunit alcohol dehydrogenase family)